MANRVSFISRGNRMNGYEHIPERSENVPAIILCHGFTGNCSEHGLFDDIGDAAAKAGYYVLRIDCAGSGDSEGDFAELTSLGGWVEDVTAAMDFVGRHPFVDASKIITMGISMGGAVSMFASRDPRVKAAVGLAPVVFPKETFMKIFSEEKWEELRSGNHVHCEYAGTEFDAAPVFLHDAEGLSVEEVLKNNEKPVLLRFGTEDDVIGPQTGPRVQHAAWPNVRVDIVEGEDHGCMNHEEENIAEVLQFLNRVI